MTASKQALKWLVENIDEWPKKTKHKSPNGWSWFKDVSGVISLVNELDFIHEGEWLEMKESQGSETKLTQNIIDNAPEGAQRYNATGELFFPYLKMDDDTLYFYDNHEGEWVSYVAKDKAEKHWQEAIELYPADNPAAEPIKLKAGHYVLTEDIEDDEQYHAICKKFIEAGADIGEYGVEGENRNSRKSVGWCAEVGLFHSDICGFYIDGSEKMADPSYQLTPEQVLSAKIEETNQENEDMIEEQQELCHENEQAGVINPLISLTQLIQKTKDLNVSFNLTQHQFSLSAKGVSFSGKPDDLSSEQVKKFFELVESMRADKEA